jgi:hypothetical protein
MSSQYGNPYQPPQAVQAFYPSGPDAPLDAGTVPDAIVEHLRRTRPWVTFLAIVGLISAGMMVLLGVGVTLAGLLGRESTGVAMAVGGGLFYLLFGVIYLWPSLGLLRYGSAIGQLIRDPRMDQLGAALDLQRSFWKVVGIMTAVMIAVVPVGLLVGLAFFTAQAMSKH